MNEASASAPGAKSETSAATFLMPFFAAQSAITTEDWGSVKLVRTMYGERSVMIDVPAAMTTCGTFACVASGAAASAAGVTPKPAWDAVLAGAAALSTLSASEVARYVPGMALSVYIRRLGAMPERVLVREMRFRAIGLQLAFGELVYTVVSVSLALRGWGGDSIIVGNICQALVMTGIVMRAAAEWQMPQPTARS